jgi:hypothetical protein
VLKFLPSRVALGHVYSVYYYDKVGKSFNGNLLQRLLEYEYFENYKQEQYKIYIISNTGKNVDLLLYWNRIQQQINASSRFKKYDITTGYVTPA